MDLFRLLLLVYGSAVIASAFKCLPQTAKCSDYWVKIEPHKNLMETEMDLNLWCNKQMRFYECLEEVLLEGKNGSLSNLPTTLLVSKLFAQDLCSDGSNNRKRLLNNAACINQLNTEYCSLPEYLDIVTPDDIPPSRCSLSEKTFSCIAATILLNCGFDAGRVYRAMLKITRYSDEVCDIEASEGIPRCEERKQGSPERDEKLSEIYYGLVHRIGTIPDQEEHDESLPLNKNNEIGVEDVVTEAIKSALDLLSEEAESENELDTQEESLHTDYKDTFENSKSYKKYPGITEIYRGILFYNFSGKEYAVYWRQPEFVVIEDINCEHLQPSHMRGVIFRCKFENRQKDPDCLSQDSVYERVTPELIRELDPEILDDSTTEYGPRPAWMKDLDAYEAKRLRDELKSMTTSETTDLPNIAKTGSTLLHVATTVAKPQESENWWEYGKGFNSIFPNDVHKELMDLFMPEPEKYEPPPHNYFRIGNSMFFLIYDPQLTNSVESVTCSRLNECHPKGRGLWRCRMWARKTETCDDCYRGLGTTVNDHPVSYVVARHIAESKPLVEKLEPTEETTEVEGSGMLEDETPSEKTIALFFSEDSEEGDTESSLDSTENLVPTVEPEVSSEDTIEQPVEEHSEIEEENEVDSHEDSGISLLILEQKSASTTEGSDFMYTVEDGVDSEEMIPVEDEHLQKNVLLFQGMTDAVNFEDLYTLLNASDDMNVLDS